MNKNTSDSTGFVTLNEDLAGFWDMVNIQIDDVVHMFNEIEQIRNNNWELIVVNKPIPATSTHNNINIKKKPVGAAKQQQLKVTTPSSKQNESKVEASRKRLLEAKRNAVLLKQKQQQEEELDKIVSNDDILIFEKEKN